MLLRKATRQEANENELIVAMNYKVSLDLQEMRNQIRDMEMMKVQLDTLQASQDKAQTFVDDAISNAKRILRQLA